MARSPRKPADDDTPPDTVPPQSRGEALLMVGVGASAGGVPALREFFAHVPRGAGLTFVVVLHLSPEAESSLAQILQNVSPIPVTQLREPVRAEPDHVYVAAPNQRVSMVDGSIHVEPMDDRSDRLIPIDRFFRTMAEVYRRQAACVVLSGTGADGTQGLKMVKEHGGLTVVQDPAEAEYPGMPRSALETRVVDLVLRSGEIPGRLAEYARAGLRLQLPHATEQAAEEASTAPGEGASTAPGEAAAAAVRGVLALVHSRTGEDFSQYKRPTLLRRLARRMQLNNMDSVPVYLEHLRGNPGEVEVLQRDLLISVTDFFRDPDVWDILEKTVIPSLFAGKGPGDVVRVWAAGCATGEEAYSLAILLTEHAERLDAPPAIQVFATDLDADAIRFAREGLYEETIAADISPERLRRFFSREGDRYRVHKPMRERVLFARHNVLRDPPFSRADLITCRNLLIYLNRGTQNRVLETFHFALRPEGHLFLGISESAEEPHHLFVPVDKKRRLFRRRSLPRGAAPIPSFSTGTASEPDFTAPTPAEPPAPPVSDLYRTLLEQHGPATVLVNRQQEIVYSSARAAGFLQWTTGEPSRQLLRVVHPNLRVDLYTALYGATQHSTVQAREFRVELEGEQKIVEVRVIPVPEREFPGGFSLVTFSERQPDAAVDTERRGESSPEILTLETELVRVRAEMRTGLEQYETTLEELRASNEELQAINEELRAASEELETSREELQSLNEELTTVNQELKIKIEEVSRANSDLQNLMVATDIGTLFLDRELRVKRYTPGTRKLFNLLPADTGRPISDLSHQLEYETLIADAEEVLALLGVVEREIRSRDGRWYIARTLPYRSLEDRIEGVVVTFTDITDHKAAAEALHEAELRFRVVVEAAADYAMLMLDADGQVTFWSPGAERIFGCKADEVLGRSGAIIFTPEDRRRGEPEREMEQARKAGRAPDKRWHVRQDGSRFWADGVMVPLRRGADAAASGFAKVLRDATAEKEAIDALQRVNEALDQRVQERTLTLQQTVDELALKTRQRERLRLQLVTAEEDARRRISRELHDQLGQTVAGLLLDLNRVLNLADLPPAGREELEEIQSVANRLGKEIQRVAVELRPPALDDLGLVKALQNYVDDWADRHGIAVDLLVRGMENGRAPAEVETAVYRIVQEALHNVFKHAQSPTASILLERIHNQLRVAIEDCGTGFDAQQQEAWDPEQRLGLLGMKERAALFGGECSIESAPGKGTTVFVRIPLTESCDPEAGEK